MNLFSVTNFFEFSLTFTEVRMTIAISCILLVIIGVCAKLNISDPKRLAWIVSLVNSGVTTVVGIFYLWVKFDTFSKMLSFSEPNRALFHGLDNVSALVCIWFACANIFDLLFGLMFYRKQLGLITAYIHHTIFIWMMVACTTGNGGFLTVTPFAPAFASMLIEEFPTFLLALGSVFPSLRTDLGFGITFFLLRICLHGFFFAFGVYSKIDTPVLVLYTLTLVMHLNWFYSWVTKYGMKLFGKDKKRSIKKGDAEDTNKKLAADKMK